MTDTWQTIAQRLRTEAPDRGLMLKGAIVIEALAEELAAYPASPPAEALPSQTSGAEAGGEAATCYNTGLRCLVGCDGRTCAGANVPLNQWPEPALTKPSQGDQAKNDLEAIYEWLREPDYAEHFDIVSWANRRPTSRLVRAQNNVEALAKPSSPAGGDVLLELHRLRRLEEARSQQPDWEKLWAEQTEKLETSEEANSSLRDVLARIAIPEGQHFLSQTEAATQGIEQYWAYERGCEHALAMVASRAGAALSPSTSAAEPVAWLTKWQFKAPDYPVKYPGGGSSITRDATEAAQELANKQRWDRVDWVRQTPLYAHPAPAAVESAQEVKEGWQPWETAPRDDKDVLAKNGDFYQVVFWDTDDNTGWHVSDANLRYPEGAFSHWRRDCLATEKEG